MKKIAIAVALIVVWNMAAGQVSILAPDIDTWAVHRLAKTPDGPQLVPDPDFVGYRVPCWDATQCHEQQLMFVTQAKNHPGALSTLQAEGGMAFCMTEPFWANGIDKCIVILDATGTMDDEHNRQTYATMKNTVMNGIIQVKRTQIQALMNNPHHPQTAAYTRYMSSYTTTAGATKQQLQQCRKNVANAIARKANPATAYAATHGQDSQVGKAIQSVAKEQMGFASSLLVNGTSLGQESESACEQQSQALKTVQ